MRTLATIYSPNKIRQLPDYVENINITEGVDYNSLPQHKVLVVGYENAKKTYPGFDILTKMPHQDRFWTFGKTERRYEYEQDLEAFLGSVINDEIARVKYTFVPISKITRACFTRLLIKMSHNKSVIYETGRQLYVIIDSEKSPGRIISFSKEEIDYCDYPYERLKRAMALTGATILPERTRYDIHETFKQDIEDIYMPYFWSLTRK